MPSPHAARHPHDRDSRARKTAQPRRPAGTDAMRDAPHDWDAVDEASAESFPASDSPSYNRMQPGRAQQD